MKKKARKPSYSSSSRPSQAPNKMLSDSSNPPQNPNLIHVDEEKPNLPLPISIPEHSQIDQIQNPISDIDENSLNPNSVAPDSEDLLEIQNSNPNHETKDLSFNSDLGIQQNPNPELGIEQNPSPELGIEQNPSVELEVQSEGGEKGGVLEVEEEEKEQEAEAEAMVISPSRPVLSVQCDSIMFDDFVVTENPPASVTRKGGKRKKQNKKQIEAFNKKLQIVKENLVPVPFVPGKSLDFGKHEELLKRVGLWEFVNIEFDREIRTDLLAMMLASYIPKKGSFVNGYSIKVSRAELARALKLQLRKGKSISLETSDFDGEKFTDEEIVFVSEVMSNWVLLRQEDTWMMPKEVVNWTSYLRQGQPQKVDWAGLIWYMVEKELALVPKLGACYYASHLQWLMKWQKEGLFEEEARVDVCMEDREEANDVKTESLEDFDGLESEHQHVELCVEQEKNVDEQQFKNVDVMGFEESKEKSGDSPQWHFAGKGDVDDHGLRRCNLSDIQDLETKDMMKEVKEEEEGRYDLPSKDMERLDSTDFLQEMGNTNISFNSPIHLPDSSPGFFFQPRVDTDLHPTGQSLFGNACKRELSHDDDGGHHSLGDHHKRMRHDGQWDDKPEDFDFCLGQIYTWMSKAKMMYDEKAQVCVNQDVVVSTLQQQYSAAVNSYDKASYELQRREEENYKLEHELHVMSGLVDGYRKALKETRRVFTEYRERNPEPEESIYKDVGGSGGVVLSTSELEKQRLAREEEKNLQAAMFERMCNDFQSGCIDSLEANKRRVHLLGERLFKFKHEVDLLKERSAERKKSKTSCALEEA